MTFDLSPYQPVRDALLAEGIQTAIHSRHQITVSAQQGSIWPSRGNSFWITHAPGTWFLFTWNSVGYALPDAARITELCRRCMQLEGQAMYAIPDKIIAEFQLHKLSENEVEDLFQAMDTSA